MTDHPFDVETECPECSGAGRVVHETAGSWKRETRSCELCAGSGRVWADAPEGADA